MAAPLPREWLTQQHRDIDAGVADGAPVAALAKAVALLREHVYLEEVLLFPSLEQAGLTMPVFVMKREHGMLWPVLDRLAAGCAAGSSAGALQADRTQLQQLLNVHNTKEEEVVYAAANRLPESLTPVLAAGRMPEGWRCAAAPRQGA